MNYLKIEKEDICNGNGIRCAIWISGCEHKCERCFNKTSWDIKSGIPFDKKAEKELFEALSKDYISGITFTGGDPLHTSNLPTIQNLVNKIHLLLPEKTIWLYTGYTLQECLNHPQRANIINKCDIIVDGRYVDELKDITLKWRGSSNQRIWQNKNGIWTDATETI